MSRTSINIQLVLFRSLIPVAMLLLLTAGCACSRLFPFLDDTTPTVSEGLPGIWHNVSMDITTVGMSVKDPATGYYHSIPNSSESIKITRESPEYAIIKFHNNEITLLGGGFSMNAEMAKPYPYTITQDSVIHSEILTGSFSYNHICITDMTKDSFVMLQTESGETIDGDTTVVSRSIRTLFKRLR